MLGDWPVRAAPDGAFTTVMSWKIEPTPPHLGGRAYGGKDVEFERFLELPRRRPSGSRWRSPGPAPRERIRPRAGGSPTRGRRPRRWRRYRDYIGASRGECSVAKNAYVATRSGWFSTRSAVSRVGKPVVVQDTGFSRLYPTGEGLFAFRTIEQAAAALEAADADYSRHCEAARALAERFFRAETVLEKLLHDAGL